MTRSLINNENCFQAFKLFEKKTYQKIYKDMSQNNTQDIDCYIFLKYKLVFKKLIKAF